MIEVRGLGVDVGGRALLRALSFTLQAGGITAVLGPNGRGKTTLLRTLLGLHPVSVGAATLAGHAAYVPQQTETLFAYDVLTMVTLGRARHLRWFATPGKRDLAIARRCLDVFHLGHLAQRPFSALSGGERQLVIIARAMASESPILVLDEPASALDLFNQDLVLSALRQLAREQGITIVFSTHHPQHAQHIADHVLLLHPDAQSAFGRTDEMCTDAQLSRLYRLPVHVARIAYGDGQLDCAIPIFR